MNEKESADFEHVFREHYKALCDLAYNLVRDRDAAKDAVQEVFLKLWKNRESVEIGENIRHYLFKATTHVAYNYLRFNKKIIRTETDQVLGGLPAYSTTDDLAFRELEERIDRAIESLPPKCKIIYLLSRHEGLKYSEIAATLDLSVKTVENQMGIALEKLRAELKPFLPRDFLVVLILILGLLYYLA